MKHLFSGSIALIIFAALVTAVPHETQSQSNTDCAPQPRNELVFTVVDKNGSVIENLRAEHLSLKVGNANATISNLVFRKTDQPLDLVVLIDASVSQEKVLPLAKAGAQSFINSVASAGRDRVAIANYVIGYCGELKGKLQLEVADPEIRKAKPVLAYKRY